MKVLFLGGVFDETMEEEILKKSKGTVHYAANKLQWNLIDGMLQIDNLELEILSAPLIGAFPKDYENIQFKGQRSVYKNVVESNYVGFNNIWGYRSISRKSSLIKGIKSFASNRDENKVIIVYSPHTPFLQAAVYAKKIDPSIHICLIVPDLPQFMNLNDKRSLIYDRLKKIDIDGILDSNYIVEFIEQNNNSDFPTVVMTEKPDLVSYYLLQGRVAIIVENSPFVIVVPAFLQDFVNNIAITQSLNK